MAAFGERSSLSLKIDYLNMFSLTLFGNILYQGQVGNSSHGAVSRQGPPTRAESPVYSEHFLLEAADPSNIFIAHYNS